MNIIVTGDIHGKFSWLNKLINKYKNKLDLVLCCGDFGYWPNYNKNYNRINTQGIPVLWCDGNHEDHWALRDLNNTEITENVFYMPRGSTYKLRDGRTILFMGGADSVDKIQRNIGIDWYPEEVITQKDLMNLPKEEIDIFITHTCPKELLSTMLSCDDRKYNDPSQKALSTLWRIYKPSLWFFGHWHHYREGIIWGDVATKWYSLSCVESESRWWMWLQN